MKYTRALARRARRLLLICTAAVFSVCSCREMAVPGNKTTYKLSDHQVAVLDDMRNEVNQTYGFVDGWPRVDRGPCGRFAKTFREQWNARFEHQINIAFIMSTNGWCDHVLVRLPDGSCFDGGNGVIPARTLLREFKSGEYIEEMTNFDLKLLDQRSYSLKRSYPLCTNYSDEMTANIIGKYLDRLPKD